MIACGTVACGQNNQACEHEYVEYAIDAKCTENGTRHLNCTKCGEVISEAIAPLGHDVEVIEAVNPTCTENGSSVGERCRRCGEYTVAPAEIAAAHSIEIQPAVQATCTEDGLTEGQYCTVCHKVLVVQKVIPAAHNLEIITSIQATCTEDGRSEGERCLDCGVVFSHSETIPAGHEYERVQSLPATCTEDGYTEGYRCVRCGYIHSGLEVISAGHKPIITPGKEGYPATCTQDGVTAERKCTECHTVISAQEVIPAIGHSLKAVSGYPATCTSVGLVSGEICKHCDLVTSEQYTIPSTGHEFDESNKCIGCGIQITEELEYTLVSSSLFTRSEAQYLVTGLKAGTTVDTVVIPDTYEGSPVIGIADGAFEGNTFIQRIIIPVSIKTVGNNAFNGCINLSSIECFDFAQSDAWGTSWYGDAEFNITAVYNYGRTPYETYIDAVHNTCTLTNYTRSSTKVVSVNGVALSQTSLFVSEEKDGDNYLKWSAPDSLSRPDSILGYIDGYIYIKAQDNNTYRLSASYEYWLDNINVTSISADIVPTDLEGVRFYKSLDGNICLTLSACPESIINALKDELSNSQLWSDSNTNIESVYTCVITPEGVIGHNEYTVDLNAVYVLKGYSGISDIGTTSIDASSSSIVGNHDNIPDTPCISNHTVVNVAQAEATCFTPGHGAYSYCSACREVIAEVTVIAPEHKYENGQCVTCGCTDDTSVDHN